MTGLPDQFTFIILGLIAFTALGVGNMVILDTHVAGGVSSEMVTGTLERLFTVPVHRLTLILGISMYYLILFTYQAITLVVGAAIVCSVSIRPFLPPGWHGQLARSLRC